MKKPIGNITFQPIYVINESNIQVREGNWKDAFWLVEIRDSEQVIGRAKLGGSLKPEDIGTAMVELAAAIGKKHHKSAMYYDQSSSMEKEVAAQARRAQELAITNAIQKFVDDVD